MRLSKLYESGQEVMHLAFINQDPAEASRSLLEIGKSLLECGLAEDAAAFLWTARAGKTVRVCFLIQNDGGVWTCRFHPFEFSKEAA